jgi:hypothetical protein
MADEWRVMATLPERSSAEEESRWATAIRALRTRLSSDIRVSQLSNCVFLYTSAANSAQQAENIARDSLAAENVTAAVRCDQWNSVDESWTSHEDFMEAERRKSVATGRAAWQVRVEHSTRHELKALAERLEAEGLSVVVRWKYLIAGANCQDDAHALADQIQHCSSIGIRIRVQPSVYYRPVRTRVYGSGGIWV